MGVKDKRKDIIMLILSVIILGGMVSLIASIIFTEFYNLNNKIWFISTIICVLILNILLIMKVMFSYQLQNKHSELTFIYDVKKQKFIDIPFNPGSVNARVLYNNLSEKEKSKIKIKDFFEQKEEFYKFCECIVVQLIFSRFLNNGKVNFKEGREINIEDLKDILVNFRYIDIDHILGNEESIKLGDKGVLKPTLIRLPKGFKVNKVKNHHINLKSDYGIVNFYWKTIIKNSCGSKIKLLSTFSDINLDDCVEVKVKLNMEYGFRLMKAFRADTMEFEEFLVTCEANMRKFDIDRNIEEFNIEIIPKVIHYLDCKFNQIDNNKLSSVVIDTDEISESKKNVNGNLESYLKCMLYNKMVENAISK